MARPPELISDDDPMVQAVATLQQGRMPEGTTIVNERSVFGDIITAQPIKVARNEPNILRRIDAMAQANGESWYYSFPVRNRRTGKIDRIEGPSIECADAVARYYGNCQVQSALAAETPTQWIFASRFVDLETGYSLIRPFLQPKSGARLGGEDNERRVQIAFGIGVSKCQRNVVDHALKDVMERAFKAAKNSLVEKIGKNLPEARARVVKFIRDIGGDTLLARVEVLNQRKVDEWLAPDVARLIAECKAIHDGMASVDETWPREAPPEPRREDNVTDVAAPASPPAQPVEGEAATAQSAAATGGGDAPPKPTSGPPETNPWRVPDDVVGQDAIIKALHALIDKAASDDHLEEIRTGNQERITKFSQAKQADLYRRMGDKSRELQR